MPQIIRIKNKKKTELFPRMFMGFQLDKKDMYNGKPLQHWLDMADELVMTTIVRGINPDKLSLVATVAAERLRGLAMVINPNLYYRLSEERDRMRAAIPMMVASMLAEPGSSYCKKHQPKPSKRVRAALKNEQAAKKARR